MAPRLTLKDLYGERGAQRFVQRGNPRPVQNGSTSPGVPNAGAPPQVTRFRRVPGQGVSIPGVAGFGAANFGAAFCRGIEPFLANLATLLSAANAAGLKNFDAIVAAQATYDDINGFLVYIPFVGNDCERNTAEVVAAIARVQTVLAASNVPPVALPRPDAQVAAPYGIPTWVKTAAILGGAALVLSYVAPAFKLFGKKGQSLSLFPQLVGYPKKGKKR